MTAKAIEPLSYGNYLRVPELLDLQTPLGDHVHDELLFIVLQQAQELWFKQILHEVHDVVAALEAGDLHRAVWLMDRVNRIMSVLSAEVKVMETLSPAEFVRFRHLLTPSSGFESEQFRELEIASGLDDPTFLRLAWRVVDEGAVRHRWPVTLRSAFLEMLHTLGDEPVSVLVKAYRDAASYGSLHALAEALSEYEMRFLDWRFHHVQLVERVIGSHAPGTGGSVGTGYLMRTLGYRFFPELWAARDAISEGSLGH